MAMWLLKIADRRTLSEDCSSNNGLSFVVYGVWLTWPLTDSCVLPTRVKDLCCHLSGGPTATLGTDATVPMGGAFIRSFTVIG